ncbi:hypothetical protein H5P28_02125 [Ruficoccus amylovorans]|uniref:Phage major capsid protein E n=1 Tax=Ruficoccus amylovorans TaxID=1804625 RepID=A0A842HAC7_9BACT|nr:hypothetical protein [Ruficoccus amylovorans]MBC2593048.1 hypothetical protein [Ruficoccus amylovorans]
MNTEKTESSNAGEITAANESRFNAAHYSEPLTAFTVGWKDPENLDELLDFVAPRVNVGRRFEFKRATNAEAFFSETDDVRAIGSAFKRVEYSGDSVSAKTLNKGLTMRIDHDEVYGDDWQERYTQILLQRLLRNELRRAISALDTAATATNHTWDNASAPDADIRAALIDATDESGVRPNRLLFGESAWDLRAAAYEAQDNAGAFSSLALDPQSLSRKLFVEGVRIAGARYQGVSGDKTGLVANAVYAFFEQNAVTKDEPSNLKRFVTPVDGGGNFRVYVEESAKYTDLTVEHYSTVIATSALGVRKLAVSAS